MALKQQVLPDNLKELGDRTERHCMTPSAIRPAQFRLFPYREEGHSNHRRGGRVVSAKAVLKKLTRQENRSNKIRHARIYPMDNGLVMTFLDDNTLAFGTPASLHSALDTRDGKRPSLDSNPVMTDQMSAVDSASCGASSTRREPGDDVFGAGRCRESCRLRDP